LDGKPNVNNTISTVGFNNLNKTVQISDGSLINCCLLDTAGQERFEAINTQYYRRADAVLLVYDITNKMSFDKIKEYTVDQIKNNCKEDIIIELLGNKSDLENQRQVSVEEGINLAMEHHYEFLESSCLQNKNVADAFLSLIERWNFKNKKNNRKKSIELKRSLTESARNNKSNNKSDQKSSDNQKSENIVLDKKNKKKSHKKKNCC
jgi:small GTP-binding protein